MADAPHEYTTPMADWFLAALLVFAAAGTADWAIALWDSTGVGSTGIGAGWIVFVALWITAGGLWALISGALLWGATGTASANPIIEWLRRRLQIYWEERKTEADAARLATAMAALVCVPAFFFASITVTAHLIAEHNVAWLIALAALAVQIGIACATCIAGMTMRRGLAAVFGALRRRGWLPWLNTPVFAVAAVLAAIVVGLYGLTSHSDLYMAVEGPALTLVVAAVVLHSVLAYAVTSRINPPFVVRHALWTAPVVALVVAGAVSQQADARRLLVLHGETAHFAFNGLQRHADLDRFFDRSDCPPLGSDGLPADGTTNEEYEQQCMNPAYDRPTSRTEVPAYDRPHFDNRPAFVLITWDSVRIDRLGYMGHERDTTPNLDAFANEGLVFDRAFTADSGTGPSFWSMMAGKTPFQVNLEHAHRFPPPIEEDEVMLGEVLEEAGYRNQAVLCGTLFDRDYWGIRWGFERFENVCGSERQRVAPTVTEQGIEALRELADQDEPFFLWVHYFDPHKPYTNHPDIGYGDDTLERYDEELTYTDEYFQKFLDVVDDIEAEIDRPLFTIVSADHGENFGEHGSAPHARNLYRNVTHVPKIARGPGIAHRRIDAPVALNDVYPTILDLADVDIPDGTTMVSQMPVYFGAEPDEDRMVFQENSWSRPRRHTRAVVYGRYHYIMDLTTNSNELYDYVDDPLERNNLIGTGLIEERIMRQALVRFLQTSTIPEGMED